MRRAWVPGGWDGMVGWDGGMGWWDGMGVGARGVDGGKGRCFEMTKIAGIFQVGKVGVMRTSLI